MRHIVDSVCMEICMGICKARRLDRWHPGHSVDIDARLTMTSRSKAMISTLRFVIVTIVIESAGRSPFKGVFPRAVA